MPIQPDAGDQTPSILTLPDADQAATARQHAEQAGLETGKQFALPADETGIKFECAAVIGAGTMGTGIAMVMAAAGIRTILIDAKPEQLQKAEGMIATTLQGMAAKRRISAEECELRTGLISLSPEISEIARADLVVEAVFEAMDVKLDLFGQIDAFARSGALLATNTSYLDVEKIARATARPEDVVGLHFFAPAHIMRLLEIVKTSVSSAQAVGRSIALAKQIGKTGVISANSFGFIGNRIMQAYIRQAHLMVSEGVEPEAVDQAIEDFGFAMGPLRIGDMSGLDVGHRARRGRQLSDEETQAFRIADLLVEEGRLGIKTGGGFYDYEAGGRTPLPSSDARRIIASIAGDKRQLDREIIAERCLYAMVGEACRTLHEGVAAEPGDIDLVYLNGYGFPKDRGGPLWWAQQQIGLAHIERRMTQLFASTGYESLDPAPIRRQIAAAGRD